MQSAKARQHPTDAEPDAPAPPSLVPRVEHAAGVNTSTYAVLPSFLSHAVGRAPRTCFSRAGATAAWADPAAVAVTGAGHKAHEQAQQASKRGARSTWTCVTSQQAQQHADVRALAYAPCGITMFQTSPKRTLPRRHAAFLRFSVNG
jgi:xanthine/CO dehydrogenase XdhC/CoxF family maturation factor